MPNPPAFLTITLAVASYVVVPMALRGFQQFTRFAVMLNCMATLAKGHPVAHVISQFWKLPEWLNVMSVKQNAVAATLANMPVH